MTGSFRQSGSDRRSFQNRGEENRSILQTSTKVSSPNNSQSTFAARRRFLEDNTLDQPVTIVLPMHNVERHLRSSVLDVLELAHSMAARLDVVVIDDGSTDETYETACELARTYPQVKVFRQPFRQGLSAALELIRNRLSLEMVVIHDGISPIETATLKTSLQAGPQFAANRTNASMRDAAVSDACGSRRSTSIRAHRPDGGQAHRPLVGFHWVRLEKPLVPRRRYLNTSLGGGAMAATDANSPMPLPMGMPSPLMS